MGFDSYSDEQLQRVVQHWATQDPSAGSMGERAKRDSLAELERRRGTQRHPAARGTVERPDDERDR